MAIVLMSFIPTLWFLISSCNAWLTLSLLHISSYWSCDEQLLMPATFGIQHSIRVSCHQSSQRRQGHLEDHSYYTRQHCGQYYLYFIGFSQLQDQVLQFLLWYRQYPSLYFYLKLPGHVSFLTGVHWDFASFAMRPALARSCQTWLLSLSAFSLPFAVTVLSIRYSTVCNPLPLQYLTGGHYELCKCVACCR